MKICFDFQQPEQVVAYTPETGHGFVNAGSLQAMPRLTVPQIGANWQPMWWHDGWKADFRATAQGVEACAHDLPAADLADRALPLWFRADLPGEGIYAARVRLVGQGGTALLFAGRRRLVWQGTLAPGECREVSFLTDVTPLVPDGETSPAFFPAADIVAVRAGLQGVELSDTDARRVFLMGDSTVTDQCAGFPYAPGTSYAGWGQMLGYYLPAELCVSNHAHSGLTTETFETGGHWAVVEPRLRPGDLCLMQFGHNDQKRPHLTAEGGYTDRLRAYIRAIRAKGATPVLVTPLARNSWTTDGQYNDLLDAFARAVHALGRAEDVPVLDLHAASMEAVRTQGRDASKCWFYPGDYTHTNDYGACRWAAFLAGALCDVLGLTPPERAPWQPAEPLRPLAPPADRTAPAADRPDPYIDYETTNPDAPLTRADALCLVTAALGLFPTNEYTSPFADVVGQAPYAPAVQAAVQANLIPADWVGDDCLHPAQSLTLKEFLSVLLPGYAIRCTLPHGESYFAQAVQAGLIPPELDPEETITRARGADICRRVHI